MVLGFRKLCEIFSLIHRKFVSLERLFFLADKDIWKINYGKDLIIMLQKLSEKCHFRVSISACNLEAHFGRWWLQINWLLMLVSFGHIYKLSVSTDQTMDTHLFYVWLAGYIYNGSICLVVYCSTSSSSNNAVCIYGLCSEAALKHNAHKARLDLVHTYGRCNTCTVHTPIEAIRGGSRKIRYNVQIWNIDNHIMMSMLMAPNEQRWTQKHHHQKSQHNKKLNVHSDNNFC